ncbi:MAG: hypothetical protein JO112_20165 [Planctomycetes bacterium]|nr:hypothetical protein [Planctomycetota bacterium]
MSDEGSDDPVTAAESLFWEGVRSLQGAAALLRGNDIPASPGAMKTEQVVTRAVEALSTTGFRVPRKG